MEPVSSLIDLFLHLDAHLISLFEEHGQWVYALLFLVIFCETGLIVTPFLPGDSLLFACGALLARTGSSLLFDFLHPVVQIVLLLSLAAILGDAVNYAVGYRAGPALFTKEGTVFLNRDHLHRAHHFYQRHGGKAIVLARFIPILRTFAPFVAGIGQMAYRRFAFYNITGGIVWVGLFITGGYAFGNLPAVKNNFTWVILGIIIVSILPVLWEWAKAKALK